MKTLSWIIGLPIALYAIVFAVFNRTDLSLDFWPFPYEADMPFWQVILGTFVVAFLLGAFVAWVSGSDKRSRARAYRWKLDDASRQLSAANKKIAALEEAAAKKKAA